MVRRAEHARPFRVARVLRAGAAVLVGAATLASSSASLPAVHVQVPLTPLIVSAPETAAPPPRSETPSREPRPSFGKAERKRLSRALDRYLKGRSGSVTVAVTDLAADRAAFAYNPKLRPVTASTVKVDIVIALLLRAQRRHRALTGTERALAERAIRFSDNAATTELWHLIGGGAGLAAANRRLGMRHTRPGPGDFWGSTVTSAADQLRVLAALSPGRGPLTARNRKYVLDLMADVTPTQAWGVSAAAGRGDRVALKNGWLPRKADAGRWTINSIGRVRGGGHDLLIAVLSSGNASMSEGVTTVEHVAELVTASVEGSSSADA
ncbi:serine hydrolase [Actinomadura sp. NPDC047616]|uniref:serine hydrolase n=1 Tax=Actinomadura sp. NPDC047616 TaxID=3155914 RepID=UPI0033EF7D75